MGIIGIIGAMDEEIHILKGRMELTETIELAGMKFHKGQLMGKTVVLVRSGIGKVNAAICAQILISNFQVSAIINTGVAGAVHDDLSVGDIVVSSDVIEHDFDVTGFGGYKLGQIPRMDEYIFQADKTIVEIAMNASKKENKNHKTVVGRILSGDVFVASREKKDFLWREFQGYCTEMEGAAIGHTCHLNQVPFVIIRAMSDKADGSAHVNFNEFVHHAANHSSEIVIDMIQHI
ncbi:methylthioadenosine nucleosidase /adenosylhomocysteine nucleosidase [Geosporobacter subterraneus DSM 17957]|uniref:adenosylhomocysteine nucleosidase n=1 Tax=Geosporobacter subterraneus DSM 17957 TaxID=1121919 RepID=A0A1M6GT49_9FIRM|nr:5'-methylthioadenosine/adenosylhomocysteine nucleosidase [Geosporobacter subterraneus]SHJ13134.1 methylthioadenosine nucleosidase /adenosylhomocysteine nucleosidase [Geosporobacter subterraneus DSM 17957]